MLNLQLHEIIDEEIALLRSQREQFFAEEQLL